MEREQLADFLRRRREAMRPAEVGIADGPRRRTTGLRREEVAALAGMSVDYVVRLEQGRSSQPSVQLLGALARALRLSDDERDHLFHLAGHRPPPADGVARLARAGLIRMLDLLGDTPALVLSDLGEALAQNRAALLLMGDHTGLSGDRRFVAYRWFTDPAVRAVTAASSWPTCVRQQAAGPSTPRSPDSSTGCRPRAQTSAGCGQSTRWRSGAPTARPCCIRGSAAC
jgi:transcriptional regulator with XRE-family HTH domain